MPKNILITGASSGFGEATAKLLTSKGFDVIGTSRKPEQVKNAVVELLALDISDDVSVTNAVQQFVAQKGSIDVLVNNAGYGLSGPIEETSIEEAKAQLDVNFFGAVRMTQAVLPHMRANNGGLIINISSLGGIIGLPYQAFYSASKFALEAFTEALRIEVQPFNIHVVNINPGDFKTAATENRVIIEGLTDTYKEKFESILNMYIRDELNGADPIAVAQLIEQLIQKEKGYKVRYLVGKRLQTMTVALKNVLSSRSFEKILRSIYK